jgi:hypothetical protein
MEIYRSIAERGFEQASSDVLTVQDLLCSGVNASNISAALRDIDEDKIIDCLKRAVSEISKEFETRDRIRWPYMLLTARFRRELRSAGARALPFDGGVTFRGVGGWIHPDIHALWINPADPKHMVVGTDGGIYQGTYQSGHSGDATYPDTGIRLWNDGGLGRMAGYNGGTAPR